MPVIVATQAAAAATPASDNFTLFGLNAGGVFVIDDLGRIARLDSTTTNDNAIAGAIGEEIKATAAPAAVSLTTSVDATVTSISLTAGDWEVSGAVNFTTAATTSITVMSAGASNVAATLGAQDTYARNTVAAIVPGAGIPFTQVIPAQRFSLASTTTIYLVTRGTFTASTLTAGGTIRARRVR